MNGIKGEVNTLDKRRGREGCPAFLAGEFPD